MADALASMMVDGFDSREQSLRDLLHRLQNLAGETDMMKALDRLALVIEHDIAESREMRKALAVTTEQMRKNESAIRENTAALRFAGHLSEQIPRSPFEE